MGLRWYVSLDVSDATKNDNVFAMCVSDAMTRYLSHDWGDIPDDDKKLNDENIKDGSGTVFARYGTNHGDICIRTDSDFVTTTISFCGK